jgi:NAD(P) transhydrogenase subunit alpha
MKIGVPRETFAGEKRVACSPEVVKRLRDQGFTVVVEAGAGAAASLPDAQFAAAGAQVGPLEDVLGADVLLRVRAPAIADVQRMRPSTVLLCFLWPAQNPELLKALAERNITCLAMDSVPRTSRAQAMDALSSMANISGYRAVVEAASEFGSFFTQQITAAGKLPAATVLVIGAGVAGLAAIAAARGLGARVRAFDTRGAVKEQVQSLGAEFLELDFKEEGEGTGGYAKEMSPAFIQAEMALFAAQARESDIIVTTALIPGKKAPTLITKEMVESMRPGSVVVDMAAEQGGNCEVTRPGERVEHQGVRVLGYTDLPSRLATTASRLYANNLFNLLGLLGKPGAWNVNLEDDVVRGALVTHQGKVTWPPPPAKPAAAPAAAAKPAAPAPQAAAAPAAAAPAAKAHGSKGHGHGSAKPAAEPAPRSRVLDVVALVALIAWTYGMVTQRQAVSAEAHAFLQHATVFVLACFVGWQVIWNVSAALHTPLMSVTNAISGIIVLGGMLQLSSDLTSPASILGAVAVLLATINIAGGFLVTQRMLKMFRR